VGASRAVWSGTLGFGLVQIPVRHFARERPDDLTVHQIDRRDGSPVGYERINKSTGERVEWKDVVKGYAVSKDRYVVVTDEDFEKANVKASQSIEIQDFVSARSIPPEFFAQPYVALPDRGGAKAYRVLRDALEKKKLVAVALVVLRTRQHLCAALPEGDFLAIELLRFAHELRTSKEVAGEDPLSRAPAPTPKEAALAEQLITRLETTWDPNRYRDSYRDDLLAAIREKGDTGSLEPHNAPARAPAGVIDLAALLEKSVSKARGERGASRKRRSAAVSLGPLRARSRGTASARRA
jgi:DNA end-binding protein Ku